MSEKHVHGWVVQLKYAKDFAWCDVTVELLEPSVSNPTEAIAHAVAMFGVALSTCEAISVKPSTRWQAIKDQP